MVEKGQENPGMAYAQSLSFDEIERLMLKEVEEQATAEDPAKGNKEGSYEKLVLMLGGSGAFQRDK